MDEVLTNLSSISWWVGVVLVGIAINLIAAYAKPRLDGTLSSVSSRWATGSAKRRAEREARIHALIASQHEQLLNRTEELRLRMRAFGYWFQAVLVGGAAVGLKFVPVQEVFQLVISTTLLLFALITLLVALDDWRLAIRNARELDVARARLSTSATPTGPVGESG